MADTLDQRIGLTIIILIYWYQQQKTYHCSCWRNSGLYYKFRQGNSDCHTEMDSKNYDHWLKTMLIQNLPPNFILVFNNACYPNMQTDKPLTSNLKRGKIKAWLLERNIPLCDNMFKAQLYHLIKLNKPKHVM
jgi:hypothetical protein